VSDARTNKKPLTWTPTTNETRMKTNLQPTVEKGDCSDCVTVHVINHPRGCIMRIGHDGGVIHLDRHEAIALYEKLRQHLGEMPVTL
jgi:hypothetical protein